MIALDRMHIFTRVAELASFTQAADTLGLPKASVSNAVRQLEATLGTRLLHRTTRRVTPTQDGQAFYERCKDLLADADELQTMFHQPEGTVLRGRVRIDMLAGPSEVLVIADHTADPAFIAADLLAQAEHDPQALALALVTEPELAAAIVAELERQLPQLARADIARTALKARGLILEVGGVAEAIELANDIAIEHLELQVAEPWQWLAKIRHAGAIFLGSWTPEAAGDYVAGPNHVLPTMGTARIASALGVETFLKKSSIISYSREALIADGDHIRRLAALEGLGAHGNSVAVRLGKAGR